MSASIEVTVGKRRSQFTATSAVFQYLLGEYITLTNLQLTVCNSEFSLGKVNVATNNTGIKIYRYEYTNFGHHSLTL